MERDEDGAITVWNIGQEPAALVEPSKPVIREIATAIGVDIQNDAGHEKNTRQLGAHVIQKLKSIEE